MPILRLLVAQIAIGAAAIFARFALAAAGPIAVSALRLGIAAVVAFAIARTLEPLTRRRELAFALAGLALAAHFAAWIASLRYTSVAISTLLVTTTPLWTELYDVVRERRTPSRRFVLALALGSLGVAAIAFHRAPPAPVAGHALFGAALAVLGSIAIGAYILIVRDAGAAGAGRRIGTRQIVARTYGWAALALVLGATLARQPPPPLGASGAWAGIAAMAFVSQGIGHTALNAALADFTPSTIALSTLLEPVIAALFAAAIFHETLSLQAALGGVFVIAAVGFALRERTALPPCARAGTGTTSASEP